MRVLDALEIDLEAVADFHLDRILAWVENSLIGTRPSVLRPTSMIDGFVIFDGDHGAFDDGTFDLVFLLEALFEHRSKVFARGRGLLARLRSRPKVMAQVFP